MVVERSDMLEINNIVKTVQAFAEPLLPEPQRPEPPQPGVKTAAPAEFEQLGVQWRAQLTRSADSVLAVSQTSSVANPTDTEVNQLAIENAPILVLPQPKSGIDRIIEWLTGPPNTFEENLPADPDEFIANSRLREDVPAGVDVDLGWPPISVSGRDNQIGDNTDGDTGNDFSPTDVGNVTDGDYFLDLDNDMRGQLGSEEAPVFYQFQPGKLDENGNVLEPAKLTYHVFYAYNDAPKGPLGIDLNHEGDWERVTIELDPRTLEPTSVVLSAHDGGSRHDINDLRDPETGRPVVYVANGSHANYATSGDHAIKFNGVTVSYDRTSEIEDAYIFDTAGNLSEVTSRPWYPNSGDGPHWGEIGETGHSSGPYGPSADKGSVEP